MTPQHSREEQDSLTSNHLRSQLKPVHIAAASLITCIAISGCGGNSSTNSEATESSKQLVQAKSDDELRSHIVAGYLNLATTSPSITTTGPVSIPEIQLDDAAEESLSTTSDSADAAAGSSSSNFSSTNLIEEGVDEADVVKFDGDYIYVAEQPTVYYGWAEPLPLFLEDTDTVESGLLAEADDGASDSTFAPVPQTRTNASIKIFASDENGHTSSATTRITLSEPGLSVEGLYLYGSRENANASLINVSSSYQYSWEYWDYEPAWQGGKTSVQIYDINDINQINPGVKLEWQGYYITSRRVDDVVYVISRHMPIIEDVVFWPTDKATEEANRQAIENADINDLIPTLVVNDGEEQPLFSSSNCFVSSEAPAQYNRPSLLSITAIDLNNPTAPKTLCTTVYDGGVYSSTQSIYISEHQYNAGDTSSRVHKFALNNGSPTYKASGEVDGTLGWSSSAFRMSEKDDYLRIVTTSRDSGIEHHLSVLKESETQANTLEVVAQIPNTEQPDTIGKPGEDIYAVRFLGDRAYVVTFERIDPLYVIDLSNPTRPEIKGALEVDGVSEYLQLLDEDTLLGIGRVDQQVQVSLFDVSDPSAPTRAGELRLGGESYSPVAYDYHALAWVKDTQSNTTRLAFPVTVYGQWPEQRKGLQLLTVDNQNNQLEDSGFVNAINSGESSYYGLERALIDGDTTHYINGSTIWSSDWNNPDTVNGPETFPDESLQFVDSFENLDGLLTETFNYAQINGNVLTLSAQHGSCYGGNWTLYMGNQFMESDPVQIQAQLRYTAPQDVICTQEIKTSVVDFSLDELQSRYQQQYGEKGTIAINLQGYSDQLFFKF